MGMFWYGSQWSINEKILSNADQRFDLMRNKLFWLDKFHLVPITFHGDTVQYVALGEAAVIKCRVEASPVAEVSWFKGQDKTRIGLFWTIDRISNRFRSFRKSKLWIDWWWFTYQSSFYVRQWHLLVSCGCFGNRWITRFSHYRDCLK